MSMRLAKLAWRVARSNVADSTLPFKLTLIVTYRCQLRCNMCNIWQRKPEGELDTDEIRRFFRTNPAFSWINVSGGEIFLRSDIDEVFAAILEESRDLYLLDFPTHGQQTERILPAVERILASRLPRLLVTVSLDGPADVHDRIRGIDGSFDKAIETFRRLRDLRRPGYRPFLGMTLQAENLGLYEQTLEAARAVVPDLHPRELHVNLAHESGHYYDNEGSEGVVSLDGARAVAELERIHKLRGTSLHPIATLERRYQKLAARYIETGKTPLPCHATSSSIFIDSTGWVRPCTIYERKIGNIRDHDYDLARLFDAAHIESLRREIRAGQCPHCWTPCEAYQTILANVIPRRRATLPPTASANARTSAANPEAGAHAE